MTIEEFQEISSRFTWHRSYAGAHIRTFIKGKECCPITAVCFVKTNKLLGLEKISTAAGMIGLSSQEENFIYNLADFATNPFIV